jgi:tetratricopeptide (TPR) repeat protein
LRRCACSTTNETRCRTRSTAISRSSQIRAVGLALVLVTVAAFWNVTSNDFVGFDDDEYITENPQVQAGLTPDSVAWAFGNYHSNNWHPLTWMVHMADWELFGAEAGGHHLTSLLFHALNALLLFLVFRRITGETWPSLFVAALFALHPTHVESVAWASEKKDVVSALFGILTIGAYAAYTRGPSTKRYLATLGLFACGLLAKPMLVTLPLVLLLLDYWPLGRCCGDPARSRPWTALVVEKLPFIVLASLSSVVTVFAQQSGGIVKSLDTFTLAERLSNSIVAYAAYLGKLVWPANLAILYPHSRLSISDWRVLGSLLLLAAITWLVFRFRGIHRAPLVGWLWFLGTLVPVIGLVQVGNQAYADRYTYIPYIGLGITIAWAARPWFDRKVALVLATVVLAAFGVRTWFQTQHWKDGISIFRHTVEVTEGNYRIHDSLGAVLAKDGRIDEALEQYREAVRIRPEFTAGQYNVGVALTRLGRIDEAVPAFEAAVEQDPDFLKAHFNLAVCHAQLNQAGPAIEHFREVLRIDPGNPEAEANLRRIQRALTATP